MSVCVRASGQCWKSLSILWKLRQQLPLTLKLKIWLSLSGQQILGIFLPLTPQYWDYKHALLHMSVCRFWGSKFSSSCLSGKHFTNWAIFPAQTRSSGYYHLFLSHLHFHHIFFYSIYYKVTLLFAIICAIT